MATEVFSLPVSTSLLAEVNAVGSPKRNKAQDGTIGDRTHMEKVSDHNVDEIGNTGSSSDADDIPEVHARDVDARGPWLIEGGAERIVQLIVANVRAIGHAKRRVKYVIFRGRIWVWRQVGGAWQFVQQVYTGVDQHNEHFHVSFEYGSGAGASNPENNTAPWGILAAYEEEDMPTADEIASAVVKKLHGTNAMTLAQNAQSKEYDSGDGRATWWHGINGRPAWQVAEGTFKIVTALAAKLDVSTDAIIAAVGGVDEAVLASLADAGKSDDEIAAALRAALGERAGAVGALLAG